jgi:hypothetical protein
MDFLCGTAYSSELKVTPVFSRVISLDVSLHLRQEGIFLPPLTLALLKLFCGSLSLSEERLNWSQ